MIKNLFLFLIRTYQTIISPVLGRHCRFYPTCSDYAAEVIEKYGWPSGFKKSIRRILKCQPFNPGGVDLP